MPKSLAVYFDEEELDLKAEIQRLVSDPRSPFYKRTMSTAAKLLLQRAIERETTAGSTGSVIPIGIDGFKMAVGDHIIVITFSGTNRYLGTLVHLAVAALANSAPKEAVFLVLPPEWRTRDLPDGACDAVARYQIHNYGDRLKLWTWEEFEAFRASLASSGLRSPWRVGHLFTESDLQSLDGCGGVRIISAISSRVMADDPQWMLAWEENLKDIYYQGVRGTLLESLPLAIVCTYKWKELLELRERMPLDELVSRTKNCHEKIIVLTEEDELLTGFEASDYVVRMVCKA
jgi:hypothetical protein